MKVHHVILVMLGIALCDAAHAQAASGSMLDAGNYRSLVADNKASRPGDVLTVLVVETSSAVATTDLRADRKSSVAGELGSSKVGTHRASAGASTDNEGGGRAQRSGKLTAQLSARIIEVLPSGDYSIQGEQRIVLNGEAQTIRLTGTVRPRDIGENNTIASGRIADANIEFDGEGFITDKSRPGWLTKLLTAIGF
jgi:flagellar L-ring protein precursor FlgH